MLLRVGSRVIITLETRVGILISCPGDWSFHFLVVYRGEEVLTGPGGWLVQL